jgi:hypothetical protein
MEVYNFYGTSLQMKEEASLKLQLLPKQQLVNAVRYAKSWYLGPVYMETGWHYHEGYPSKRVRKYTR